LARKETSGIIQQDESFGLNNYLESPPFSEGQAKLKLFLMEVYASPIPSPTLVLTQIHLLRWDNAELRKTINGALILFERNPSLPPHAIRVQRGPFLFPGGSPNTFLLHERKLSDPNLGIHETPFSSTVFLLLEKKEREKCDIRFLSFFLIPNI